MSTKQLINVNNKYDRVVVLVSSKSLNLQRGLTTVFFLQVDMDCFYCQVEEKLNPEIKGQPIAVVQYNPWQGGG